MQGKRLYRDGGEGWAVTAVLLPFAASERGFLREFFWKNSQKGSPLPSDSLS